MDLLNFGSVIKQFTLGVSLSGDTLRLALLCYHWNRLRTVGLQTISPISQASATERCEQVQSWLKRHGVIHYDVVLSLPRREVLLRDLELPAEARENLDKVVEYQMVHLLPSEEQAVSYDYLAAPEEAESPRLRTTVFVVLSSVLQGYVDLCEELGLRLDRIIPRAVALANYVHSAVPRGQSTARLIALLDDPGGEGELVGMERGQLKLCKNFEAGAAGLAEALESEVNLFRGQSQLAEETPVEVFVVGAGERLRGSEAKPFLQAVPTPEAAEEGQTGTADQETESYLPAIAAAYCGLKGKCALDVNLLPGEQRIRKSRWEMIPTYGLLAVNVLLLLGLLFRGPLQHWSYSEGLSQELERLEPSVKAFRELEAETALWRERAQLLKRHRQCNGALLSTLADLSLILPKDSMVRDLSLEDGVIQIQGTSGQAAALPKILEDSSYFKQAELVSAIARDPQGKETYRIQASLEDPLLVESKPGVAGAMTSSARSNSRSEGNR